MSAEESKAMFSEEFLAQHWQPVVAHQGHRTSNPRARKLADKQAATFVNCLSDEDREAFVTRLLELAIDREPKAKYMPFQHHAIWPTVVRLFEINLRNWKGESIWVERALKLGNLIDLLISVFKESFPGKYLGVTELFEFFVEQYPDRPLFQQRLARKYQYDMFPKLYLEGFSQATKAVLLDSAFTHGVSLSLRQSLNCISRCRELAEGIGFPSGPSRDELLADCKQNDLRHELCMKYLESDFQDCFDEWLLENNSDEGRF